ncbi:MAG: hypothetical protein Q9193_001824 [Seirophora villosa]
MSGSLSRGSKNAIQETLVREFEHHTALLAAYDKSANPTRKSAQLRPFKTVILHSEATMDVQKLCGVRYDWLSSQAHREQAIEDWKAMEQCDVVEVLSIPGNHFEAFMPENVSSGNNLACAVLTSASDTRHIQATPTGVSDTGCSELKDRESFHVFYIRANSVEEGNAPQEASMSNWELARNRAR